MIIHSRVSLNILNFAVRVLVFVCGVDGQPGLCLGWDVCVSHGRERRTRDNPTTRHKGQENHSCAPVSAHTHTLFLSCLPGHLLCQINLDISRVHNGPAISTAWSSERKRALWENFPFVCGLRGFLLLICSSVIYGAMNGEGLEGLIAQESATFQAEIGRDLFRLRAALWCAVFYIHRNESMSCLPVLGEKKHV